MDATLRDSWSSGKLAQGDCRKFKNQPPNDKENAKRNNKTTFALMLFCASSASFAALRRGLGQMRSPGTQAPSQRFLSVRSSIFQRA
jgi:hypothetical protein